LQGGNPKQKLEKLYIARDPIYTELADYIVDTGAQSAIEITSYIDQLLQRLCNSPQQEITQTDN
jgi:shikimate kinase